MNNKHDDKLTSEEIILREKARQAMKKNKTPTYAPNDEGGLLSGPSAKKDMKKQVTENDK